MKTLTTVNYTQLPNTEFSTCLLLKHSLTYACLSMEANADKATFMVVLLDKQL